jgi:hypothetical protein
MTTADSAHEISPEQLPVAINTYLAAHQARDIDTAVLRYALAVSSSQNLSS